MATNEEQLLELQMQAAKLDVEKSKLTEQLHQLNADQQKLLTKIYELYLDAYKKQAFTSAGGLVVPAGGTAQVGNKKLTFGKG